MERHSDGYLIKLVRDRVADTLGGDGTVTYRAMPHAEHVKRLRGKLLEEALEYVLDPSTRELADVLEVVAALAQVDLCVSFTETLRMADERRIERGGFDQGVGMYVFHPYDEGTGT